MKKLILFLGIGWLLLGASPQGPRVSLDLEGTEVAQVIRTLARIGGINVVISEGVTGTVTLKLQDVSWRKALETVLKVKNLAMVEEDGIYRVMTGEEYENIRAAQPIQTRIFKIRYARADKLRPIVEALLSPKGRIQVDERSNALVLMDTPPVLEQVRQVLDSLDSPVPQVRIQAKIVEIDYDVARSLGIVWGIGNQQNPEAGVPWRFSVEAPVAGQVGSISFGYLLPQVQLDAMISALESERKANVLSQPSIVVQNNTEAMILSGKKVPILTRDQAGNVIVEFYDVALKLTVRPRISPEGWITVELHPEVSDLAGAAGGLAGPVITSQEAQTTVTVRDGETIVIGGILKQNETQSSSGVPILSKIPLIGQLFRNRDRSVTKTDIMIFVTPTLINKEQAQIP